MKTGIIKSALLLAIFLILFVSIYSDAQDVVINEYTNAASPNDEWTELLVIKDNTDMRNWTLNDNNSATLSPQAAITFNNIPLWNNLRAGTIIVIWHRNTNSSSVPNPPTNDDVSSDGYVEVNAQDANYFTGGNFPSNTLNIAISGDLLQLRDASATHVHALGHKSPIPGGGTWSTIPGPKLNYLGSFPSFGSIGVCPGGSIADYGTNTPQSGTTYTSFNITPLIGRSNGGCPGAQNLGFVRSLREPKIASQSYTISGTNVLTWTSSIDPNPLDYTMGYLVVRGTTNSFSSPNDGLTYNIGEFLNDGEIIADITGSMNNTYTDASISTSTGLTYYYRVIPYRYNTDDINGNFYASDRGRAYNTTNLVDITLIPPPVVLATAFFKLKKREENGDLLFTWKNMGDNSKIIIEMSLNGIDFKPLADLNGTSNEYYFAKESSDKGLYFRLKSVDQNGSVSYSNIIQDSEDELSSSPLFIYPNPTNDYLTIESPFEKLEKENISVQDLSGRVFENGFDGNKIDMTVFSSGTYILLVKSDSGNQYFKIVKE